MTTATMTTAKTALDLVSTAAKVIALIVALVLAWSAIRNTVDRQDDRITRVEADVRQFQTDLRAMNEKVNDIAIGVATLVERTKPKDKP